MALEITLKKAQFYIAIPILFFSIGTPACTPGISPQVPSESSQVEIIPTLPQQLADETKLASSFQRYLSLSEQAAKLEQAGNYEKAAEIYRETIPLVPEIWAHEPYERLGRVCYRLGRYQEAVDAYKHAIRLHPNGLYFHFRVGEALERLGDRSSALHEYNLAMDAYKQAIRRCPDQIDLHIGLGEAFERLGDRGAAIKEYKIAVEAYKQALSRDPDLFFFLHFDLGEAFIRLGDRGAALEEYKTLKTRNPELAKILFDRIYKQTSPTLDRSPR